MRKLNLSKLMDSLYETGEYYAEKASILQLRKCVVRQLNLLMSYKI